MVASVRSRSPATDTAFSRAMRTTLTALPATLRDRKAIGWRARLGVAVPMTNTVCEAEFNRLSPEGVSFHFIRMPPKASRDGDPIAHIVQEATDAAKGLAMARVSGIAFACTADSMACPADKLIPAIENNSKASAISTADAIVAALRALGLKKIGMASPYRQESNKKEAGYLARHGIEVVAMAGLGLDTPEHVGEMSRVPPPKVFEHALSVDRPEVDGILICCTDFNTLDVIDLLEKTTGKPVISSVTATFWNILRRAGIKDKVPGYGRLLAEH
ncbi:MAG: decarboxylase [Alphaproteobacteria bacterium]|nr:decarboxylase [Alphaproteobacteria bacterium]